MQIIKLNAIDSTNSFLKREIRKKNVSDFTVVVAKKQEEGRGQMGTLWEANPSYNLTFSVFKKFDNFQIPNQFYLNISVALAVFHALKFFEIPNVKIKWPNDILAGNKKICGILIENMIKGDVIINSVIGIGLNINQIDFTNLPKASSLKKITGTTYDLDEVLNKFLETLKKYFQNFEDKQFSFLAKKYDTNLFRKNKPSTFKAADGSVFMGFITGVSNEGKLVIKLEDDIIKEFALKELSLLY